MNIVRSSVQKPVETRSEQTAVLRRLRTWDWLYLGYLVFPLAQPMFTPHASGWNWGLAIGICVATAGLFAVAVIAPARSLWWSLVPMAVLGTLTTPFNAGASVLFIYAAAGAGGSRPRREALRWFAGLTALVVLAFGVSAIPLPYRFWGLVPSLALIWIIGSLQLKQRDQQREAENLRLRNARIELLATIAERERIARDLHDLLGHSLTAVVMRAQLTKELVLTDPRRARVEAEEIERNAREALGAVRGTVAGWRRATLGSELDAARRALSGTGVRLRISCDENLILLSSTEHELALALREAVTNVARHHGHHHRPVGSGHLR
ncbi:MAG TPA: histidine kinase [Pseudonocardiaceae bacterium]|jgi:two-component system sensor histidine kinase DesK|nr:histidine kinase [Pseudonocardiaceae bacterium]